MYYEENLGPLSQVLPLMNRTKFFSQKEKFFSLLKEKNKRTKYYCFGAGHVRLALVTLLRFGLVMVKQLKIPSFIDINDRA